MKLSLRGLAAGLLLVAVMIMVGSPPAKAADGFNIITSPLPLKLSTAPGKTVEAELRMKNQGTDPERIKVGLMRFAASGDTGEPDLFDLTPKDTYASWVHFSPTEFTAEPGVWKTVKMTINVPPDASLGYYLAVTFSRASQTKDPKATSVRGAVATLVLLDARTGDEKRQLKLVSLSATHGLYEYLPAEFKIKIRNTGNIYLAPVGNIFIQRGGKTIDTLNFNAAGGSVLPDSNRLFTVPWSNGFPVYRDRVVNGKPVPGSNGRPQQNLKWDFTQANKLRTGRYTAKLLVVYDDGKKDVPLQAEVSFWVIPWKIILILLLLISLLGFGVFSFVRSAFGKAKRGTGKYRRGRR